MQSNFTINSFLVIAFMAFFILVLQLKNKIEYIEELRKNESLRYKILVSNSSDVIFDWNKSEKKVFWSENFERLFGARNDLDINESFEKILNHYLAKDLEKKDPDVFVKRKQIGDNETFFEIEQRITKDDSDVIWVRTKVTIFFDKNNNPKKAIGIVRDITEKRQLLKRLELEKNYREVTSDMYDVVYEADISNNITIGNWMKNLDHIGSKKNNTYNEYIELISNKTIFESHRQEYIEKFSRENLIKQYQNNVNRVEFRCLETMDGNYFYWVKIISYIYYAKDAGIIKSMIYVKNIDEEVRRETEIMNKLQRDPLSNLYNKLVTKELTNEYLSIQREESECISALFMIDIDNFKQVNDKMGHFFGDNVIIDISKKLKNTFRVADVVGRVGGDEFIVFMKDAKLIESINEKAEEIRRIFSKKYIHDGKSYDISASIGICISPEFGKSYDDLYTNADKALYESKKKGKNQYSYYTAEIEEKRNFEEDKIKIQKV